MLLFGLHLPEVMLYFGPRPQEVMFFGPPPLVLILVFESPLLELILASGPLLQQLVDSRLPWGSEQMNLVFYFHCISWASGQVAVPVSWGWWAATAPSAASLATVSVSLCQQ